MFLQKNDNNFTLIHYLITWYILIVDMLKNIAHLKFVVNFLNSEIQFHLWNLEISSDCMYGKHDEKHILIPLVKELLYMDVKL
jgi:hypothetical protein